MIPSYFRYAMKILYLSEISFARNNQKKKKVIIADHLLLNRFRMEKIRQKMVFHSEVRFD